MSAEQLQVEHADGIHTVRINRPAQRNVLSIELMQALTQTAQQLQEAPDCRAVILAASGANFSAGVDLKDPRRWNLDKASLAERRAFPYVGERMCQAWEDIPAMTICAIEGYCVGGGAALAICTDFRIVGASAYLRFPEVAIGLPLSWGALPRLVRLLGPVRAKRAIILCEKLVGAQAVEFGLADMLAADGQAYAEAQALAARIAALPEVAVKMSKEAINVTSNALNRLGSYMARDQVTLAAHAPDAIAARAKFMKKKPAR
ncbi:MAG: enoyl-CoA hydratase/isomerase family protein [Burkholderiales bacterium]